MSNEEVVFTIGVVVILLGVFNLMKALTRRGWPETVGKIQKNEVNRVTSSFFNPLNTGPMSDYSSKSLLGTDKEEVLRLSYVYVVEKYKYVGSQLYSAPVVKVRSRIAGLSEGDKVKVFYNPRDPKVSFLAHSFAWPSTAVILIGLSVVTYSAYVFIGP